MRNVIRISLAFSSAFLLAACFGCAAAKIATSNTAASRPLRTPQAASNRPKIIALGDSLTAGFGLAEKESYPYLLQEKLNADGYAILPHGRMLVSYYANAVAHLLGPFEAGVRRRDATLAERGLVAR